MRNPPEHLLACPTCQADTTQGFEPENARCTACDQQFYHLAGMPCFFDVGIAQKRLWESLYALAIRSGEINLERNQNLEVRDMPARTRERIAHMGEVNNAIVQAVDVLLGDMGLEKTIHQEFHNYDPSRMLQYFELLLRDWAWDGAKTIAGSENDRELQRVCAALEVTGRELGDTWVIGAGAGRLSFDIHTQLKPTTTIALDTNPVLISCAHRLVVEQKLWQLPELHPGPQKGFDLAKVWPINPPDTANHSIDGWHAVAGNAWRPPLKKGSFDTIITPWFIDVNGREARELIGQVQKYLKPGGLWINTGPLLYGPDIQDIHRYSHQEILDLIGIAGFKLLYQNTVASPYLDTPLSEEKRIEQIWTFAATAPLRGQPLKDAEPPAWITLAHLSIPQRASWNTQGNPVLEHLAAQVDGKRSINDIADMMRANLGPDKDPVQVVKGAFLEYLL